MLNVSFSIQGLLQSTLSRFFVSFGLGSSQYPVVAEVQYHVHAYSNQDGQSPVPVKSPWLSPDFPGNWSYELGFGAHQISWMSE